MPSHRDYSSLDRQEYFQITQFDRSFSRPASFEAIVDMEDKTGKVQIYRVEITRALADKILIFIDRNSLSTRGKVRLGENPQITRYSRTIYTVRFALHVVVGKRGGWYVLQNGGREPIIPNEFVEYGPKRKSGGRKNSYRRDLSSFEENEVRAFEARTPSLEQMYRWIVRKYPDDVLNLDWSGEQPPSCF